VQYAQLYVADADPKLCFFGDVDPDVFLCDANPDISFLCDADPDISFLCDANPDISFLCDADPDISFLCDADPDISFLCDPNVAFLACCIQNHFFLPDQPNGYSDPVHAVLEDVCGTGGMFRVEICAHLLHAICWLHLQACALSEIDDGSNLEPQVSLQHAEASAIPDLNGAISLLVEKIAHAESRLQAIVRRSAS